MKLTNFYLFFFTLLFATSMQAQTVFWGGAGDANGEFDGGLNDWTAIGVSSDNPDSAANALWLWDADGVLDRGFYWGSRVAPTSTSIANGVAAFNSDYLAAGGLAANSPGGPAPSPHRGDLISPSIDLSAHNAVALQFYGYFRKFSTSQFYVEISTDGGNTFPDRIDVQAFTDLASNAEVQGEYTLNISSIAGGQSDVRIKFVFDGDYYFAMVDDVAIVEAPCINLGMTRLFYTPAYFSQTPDMIANDPFLFQGDFHNSGAMDADVRVYARVASADLSEIVYETSIDTVFPSGFADTIAFPDLWDPTITEPGDYVIQMEVENLSTSCDDFTPDNNSISYPFYVDGECTTGGPAVASTFSGITSSKAVGYFFDVPDFAAGSELLLKTMTIFSNATDLTTNPNVYATIARSDWFGEFPGDANGPFDSDSIEVEGLNIIPLTADNNNDYITIRGDEMLSPLTGTIFEPTSGETYMVMAYYDENNQEVQHGYSAALDVNSSFLWIGPESTSTNWYSGWSSNRQAYVEWCLGVIIGTDSPQLPESSLSFTPNPAQTNIDFTFSFDQTEEKVSLIITDMTGAIIKYVNLDHVQQSTETFDVSDLSNGMYLVQLSTNSGNITKKFVVQH